MRLSQILALTNFTLLCIATTYGLGRRARFVSRANRTKTLQILFASQLLFYWAIALIKLSVALLLVRIKTTPRWRAFLYSIMSMLALVVIVQTFFQFLQCRPFSVYWDPTMKLRTGGVQCIPMGIVTGNIVAGSTVHVATDIIFSLIPISFIRKLQRPTEEKIFLCALMGLGLFASAFAILRTVWLKSYGESGDLFRENVMPTLWASLELAFAMIAATMPTLKNVMQKCLNKIGSRFYEQESESKIRGNLVDLGFLHNEDETKEWSDVRSEKAMQRAKLEGEARKEQKREERFANKINNEIGFDMDSRKSSADVGLDRPRETRL